MKLYVHVVYTTSSSVHITDCFVTFKYNQLQIKCLNSNLITNKVLKQYFNKNTTHLYQLSIIFLTKKHFIFSNINKQIETSTMLMKNVFN